MEDNPGEEVRAKILVGCMSLGYALEAYNRNHICVDALGLVNDMSQVVDRIVSLSDINR